MTVNTGHGFTKSLNRRYLAYFNMNICVDIFEPSDCLAMSTLLKYL